MDIPVKQPVETQVRVPVATQLIFCARGLPFLGGIPFFPEALRRVLLLKAAANFTCQFLMPTCRELLHLPTSHANFSRVISSANFSCQLFESYFTCQLLMPTFRELLRLPTSHASFSRVTSPANFSCQLFGCYLMILKTQANFSFLPSHLDFSGVISLS